MIFETHAHYDDEKFKNDQDETIKRVHDSGVDPIINVGASIGSTKTTLALADKYELENDGVIFENYLPKPKFYKETGER